MKLTAFLLCSAFACSTAFAQVTQPPPANPTTVGIVRALSKELFDLNSEPFVKPLVESINATSNARFFSTARVPKKNSFYVRASFNGMIGGVNESQKTYAPAIPREQFDITKVLDYGTLDITTNPPTISIRDTIGFATYMLKAIIDDQIKNGGLTVPERSATVLGSQSASLRLPGTAQIVESLRRLIPAGTPIGGALDSLESLIRGIGLPAEGLDLQLPTGGNVNQILAIVPQFEIGSLYGTELLVRFIPTLDWGATIGKFGFWGIGVRHSISQYFNKDAFDLSVQAVYQGTTIENTVGVTGAKLDATATILNTSLQASKQFGDLTIFTAINYDGITSKGTYTYALPRSLQAQLGLLYYDETLTDRPMDDRWVARPDLGYTGDTNPQQSAIEANSSSVRWTIGAGYNIGPASIFADFNMSRFNVFSAGIAYRFGGE